MFDTIKSMVGLDSTDYSQLVKEGAIILDVRSKGEYACGHVKGSMNIAVDRLESNLGQLKNKEKTIITCCASGMRSGSAKSILEENGYQSVYNGGAWQRLNQKLG
ncbi:MAG: rhodanese-like domain-containing protein [Cyclobacteriaceae bacterium]